MTTTSTGAEAVLEWFEWWNAIWRMDVEIVNVTGALAAVNVAGPNARELIGAAHRPRRLGRGVHVPRREARARRRRPRPRSSGSASSASSATRSTSRARTASTSGTRSSSAAPTSACSRSGSSRSGSSGSRRSTSSSARTPTPSRTCSRPAMPWIVKLDKDDFVGKWSLEHVHERGFREQLVGFEMENGVVPARGRPDRRRRPARRPRDERPLERPARPARSASPGCRRARRGGRRADIKVNGSARAGAASGCGPFFDPDEERLALVSAPRLPQPRLATRRRRLALAARARARATRPTEIAGPLAARQARGARRARRARRGRGRGRAAHAATARSSSAPSRTRAACSTRLAGARRSVVDLSAALAGPRRSTGETLMRRLTDLDLDASRPSGSLAHVHALVLRDGETFRLFFPQEYGHYVAEVVARRGRRAGRMKDLFRVRRMWRPRGELKDRYDVVIVGGGSHGLATAYYLAKNHGITDVAVLEKSYIGSGAAGRNTTIIRANYRTPEGAAFYKESVKLYERPRRRPRLQPPLLAAGPPDARALGPGDHHADRARRGQPAARDRQPRHLPRRDREALPGAGPLAGRRPGRCMGALYHPPGGIIRHDAVVWGFARGADRQGVEIHPYTEVTGIDRSNGRVTGVETTRGRHRVRTWSSAPPPAGRRSSPTSPACRSRSRRTSSRPSSPSR